MSWETPDGARVVSGYEARLLKHAFAAMVDTYELDCQAGCEPAEYGITLFDELDWDERLGVLDHIGQALFSANTSPPAPSAVLDAAVAAIFNQILHEIEFEIETTEDNQEHQRRFWRTLVADAFREAFHNEPAANEAADDACLLSEEQRVKTPEPLPNWLIDNSSSELPNQEEYGYFTEEDHEEEEVSFSSSLPDLLAFEGMSSDDLDESWLDDESEDGLDDMELESGSGWVSIYDSPPAPDCRDLDVWYDVIDALTDRILSDRDFRFG